MRPEPMTLKARDLRTWDRADDGRTVWRLQHARGSTDVLVTMVTLKTVDRSPRPGAVWLPENPHTFRYDPDTEITVMRWCQAPDGTRGVPYDIDGNGHRWPDWEPGIGPFGGLLAP